MQMQFPVSFSILHHNILLHVVIEPLAMFIGFRYYLYLRKKQGDRIESENRRWIILAAAIGALVGSRLIGGLENIPEMVLEPNKWQYFFENKTVLGGLLGSLAGVEAIKKLIGEKQNSGDLFVFPFALALIIGRIGCFSMGVHEQTFGVLTTLPTGLDLGDGMQRYPVTLYEIGFLAFLWITLEQLKKRYVLANGLLFKLFLIAYCLFRFFLDFIKPHYSIAGLSVIQYTSLVGLSYYLVVYLRNKAVYSWVKRSPSPHA